MPEGRKFELGGKPLKDIPDDVLAEALKGLSVIPEWRHAIQAEQGLRARHRREAVLGDDFEEPEPDFEYIYHGPGF